MTRRTERLNEVFKREISKVIERDINDPRLNSLISITRVETSSDIRHAKIYVSITGNVNSRDEVMAGFNDANNFIRRKLASCVRLRTIPKFTFYYDDSIERGAKILNVMNEIMNTEDSR
jgi:ribosome-binding factor A